MSSVRHAGRRFLSRPNGEKPAAVNPPSANVTLQGGRWSPTKLLFPWGSKADGVSSKRTVFRNNASFVSNHPGKTDRLT
jgi:hypothetical protein